MSAGVRRLVAIAAFVALQPLAAAGQPTSVEEQDRLYAAAQVEYEIGHYALAFTGFAGLADAGHVESARIALQMQRHGTSLYRMRFAAGPKQIGRWTTLLSCRGQAAASTGACASVAGAEAPSRR